MSLTDEDLGKIKAVVDAGAESTKAYVDRRLEQSERRLEARMDARFDAFEERMGAKIDSVKTMLEEDHRAVVEDVAELQSLPMIAAELAKK